jgi:hypothetical protein
MTLLLLLLLLLPVVKLVHRCMQSLHALRRRSDAIQPGATLSKVMGASLALNNSTFACTSAVHG